MSAVWNVARRELRAFLDHPTGYILLIVFLAVNNFLFFRTVYLMQVATLRPMMDLLPWLFLFFVPAITMRSLAEDRRSGTMEVVLAQPITESQYLLGKYLGQLLLLLIALALTLAIPLGLSIGADLQVGVMVAQYAGTTLLAAGLAAVGVWASSLTRNQITAFIIGVAVMFVLVLLGLDPLVVGLPPALGSAAARLSVLSHFSSIGRGVIDLRDVVYFVTLAAVFLALAYLSLMSRKLSPRGASVGRLRLGVTIMVAGMVVVNLFGRHIGGRLDLTPGNAYTLSQATRQLVSNLDDIVTIDLYASEDLPPEVSLMKRDIDDLLSDYRSASGGNVRVVEKDPSEDEDLRQEARTAGIPPVQFNVIGQSELQVKEGYLGLVVRFADGNETIPFIRRTEDLEYRITSFIKKLVDPERPVVGLAVVAAQPNLSYGAIRGQLAENYEVRSVSLPPDSTFSGDSLSALVIAGDPTSLTDEQAAVLQDYLTGGGSLLITASGMVINPQQPIATTRPVAVNRVMDAYGVQIRQDMAFDLLSNERISTQTNLGRVVQPYPFWIRAASTRESPINQDLESVFMPWSSTIDTSLAPAGTVTPLIVTSRGGGSEANSSMIMPGRRDFDQDNLGVRLLGVQINPNSGDAPDSLRGRLVVVGSSTFLTDSYARQASENFVFALNAVDWLTQDDLLISIRSKDRQPPQLQFESEARAELVKYGNLIGVPVLLVLLGAARMIRRRSLTTRGRGGNGDSSEPEKGDTE